MNCDKCGSEIHGLFKRYFSSKLRCPYCRVVVDTWPMSLHDYWMDLLMLIGVVHDGNKGRF